jgi:hypothetical protein
VRRKSDATIGVAGSTAWRKGAFLLGAVVSPAVRQLAGYPRRTHAAYSPWHARLRDRPCRARPAVRGAHAKVSPLLTFLWRRNARANRGGSRLADSLGHPDDLRATAPATAPLPRRRRRAGNSRVRENDRIKDQLPDVIENLRKDRRRLDPVSEDRSSSAVSEAMYHRPGVRRI